MCGAFDPCYVAVLECDLYQTEERRVHIAASFGYLAVEHRDIVEIYYIADYAPYVVRALYYQLSTRSAPAHASRYLNKELECVLRCTEVGKAQEIVGIDYPHEPYVVEVEPFAYHLSAYYYVGLVCGYFTQYFAELAFGSGYVGIEPYHARFGYETGYFLLYVLCAYALRGDVVRSARWASAYGLFGMAAVVTFEPVFSFVVCERYVAVGT